MAITLGDLLFRIKGDNAQLMRSIDQAEGRAKSMADRVKGFVSGTLMHAAGNLLSTGIRTAVAATAKVVKEGISEAADYQQSLIETRTIAQLVGEDITKIDGLMAQVRAKSMELGKDATLPGVTPADVAATINALMKGNLTLQQSIDASRGSLQLATLAQIGFGDAADMTSGILNMFGLSGTDAARVIDLIAGASIASSKSVGDMGTGISQGGFAFAAAKRPIEEFVTALTIATNAGLGGSDAGTAIKNAMIRMMAPTKGAAKEMSRFGVSFYDASGKMKPFPQIVNELNGKLKVGEKITLNSGKATKKQAKEVKSLENTVAQYMEVANDETRSQGERVKAMDKASQASAKLEKLNLKIAESGKETVTVTEEMRNAFLQEVFLSDGMKAMIPILEAGADGWAETEGKVTKAGAALELAGTKAKGTKGAWEGLVSTVQTMAQKLLEPFIGTDVKVGIFEKALRGVIQWLDGVPFEAYAEKLGRIVEILFSPYEDGGLLGVLEELGVDQTVIDNLATLGGSIKLAFEWIATNGPSVSEGLGTVGDILGGAFKTSLQWLVDNQEGIKTVLWDIGGALSTGFQWLVTNGPTLVPILQAIVIALGTFLLLSGVAGIIGTISAAVATLGATFIAAGGGIAGVVAILGGPVIVVLGLIAIAVGLLYIAWTENWGGIQQTAATAGATISTTVGQLTAKLTSLWQEYGPTVTSLWNKSWDDMGTQMRGAKANLEQIGGLIKLTLEGKWRELGVQLGIIWRQSWDNLVNTLNSVKVRIFSAVGSIVTEAQAKFKNADWNAIGRDIVNGVAAGIKAIGSSIAAAITSEINKAIAAARTAAAAARAIVNGIISGASGGGASPGRTGQQSVTPSAGGSASRSGINSFDASTKPTLAGAGGITIGPNYISNDLDIEVVAMQVVRRIREATS